jgi:phosphate-selective porin
MAPPAAPAAGGFSPGLGVPGGPPYGFPAPAAPVPAEGPASGVETSGYHNGTFFIRDKTDSFRLYLQGRVHADWLDQLGAGTGSLPPGNGITNGFYLRRARLELGGELFQQWQWQLSAEFSSSTSIDNAAATLAQPTCSVSATTSLLSCTNKESPVDNPTVKAIPTDVFVNYGPSPWANVEAGQFFIPFSLENRISDNVTPFLERSLPVRNIAAPLQRDIGLMFWGESPDRTVYYAAALVNGDGPNRANVDGRYDGAARVVVRPLAKETSFTKWAQIGGSVRGGSRDATAVGYDVPSLTTQGGYAFWKPTYKDSFGRTNHILPSKTQWAVAGDIYLPVGNFDVTGEFVYADSETREAVDGFQLSPFTERVGHLKGYGWYAQAAYWIIGDHDVIGYPSYGRPIHLDLSQPQRQWKTGVQVLAKFEQLHMTYSGASRGGALDPQTPNGDIEADTVSFGVNYWVTRHLRVGVNYGLNMFPDAAPTTASTTGGPVQSSKQRAVAPGQLLAKGVDDGARDGATTLNEVQVRVGVQF